MRQSWQGRPTMKNAALVFARQMMIIAIRLHGWTNKPKPEPFKPSPHFPWWRNKDGKKGGIEITDLARAWRIINNEKNKAG